MSSQQFKEKATALDATLLNLTALNSDIFSVITRDSQPRRASKGLSLKTLTILPV